MDTSLDLDQDRIRVLVVDDDEDDYVITRHLLQAIDSRRFVSEWVASYGVARDLLLRNQHDVCLLDYRLDPRDGLELIREVRADGCRTPVILLTGQGDLKVDVEAMKAGAMDYLVKSQIDATLLERSIRYAVERQRAAETLRMQSEAMNTSVDGIAICDQGSQFTYVNDALFRMYGYESAAELEGKPWTVLYDDKELDRFERGIIPRVKRDGQWRGETVGKRKKGRKPLPARDLSERHRSGSGLHRP